MAQYIEEQISSREVYSGPVFRVTKDEARLARGNTGQRDVVHHNGGACVLAMNGDGKIALIRQYRYAVSAELIELPAGKLEPGEQPLEAAKRELAEEAGVSADVWRDFGSVIPTCGYSSEVIYIFLATGLHNVGQHLEGDEDLTLFWMPLEQAAQMVMDGSITDSKTVSGISRLYIESNK